MPPLSFWGEPFAALEAIAEIVKSLPRTKIVRQEGGYLHAEFTSSIFRYVDDVEFLLDAEAKLIHFRSASRRGYGDLGANRNRMEAISQRFASKH